MVDHDHKTDKVRGLLCDACNRGIGFLREDLKTFKKAIKYLEENCANTTLQRYSS